MIKICLTCKKSFKTFPSRIGKYCSYRCSAKRTLNGFSIGHIDLIPKGSRKKQGLKMRQYCGEKSWNWKPWHDLSLRAKHRKMQLIKGKAKLFSCECGTAAIEYSNVSHKYLERMTDYVPMCRSCHVKYDIKMGFRPIPFSAISKS